MKERLLTRISAWGQSTSGNAADVDSNEFADSIRRDMENLYNTRQGTVLIDEQMGMPDFSDMFNGYAAPDVGLLQKSLLDQTKRYEKRLQSIEVNYDENRKAGNSLNFLVSATVMYKEQELPFSMGIALNDDGSVKIST